MTCRKVSPEWWSEKYWRKNKLAHGFALLSTVAFAATGTFAVEDQSKVNAAGLAGIFPASPPSDLSESEFSRLDGNWADWSKGASAAVADFYTKAGTSDVAAQRAALGTLKNKLDVMERALQDSSYKSLHSPLSSLQKSLALRVDLAEAALDTLEGDGDANPGTKIQARSEELLAAINALEADLAKIPNGSAWLPYFRVDTLKAALTADPKNAATVTAANQALANLQSRDYLLDGSQKEFSHRPAFETYATAVNHYVNSAVWLNAGETKAKLRDEFKTLASAVDTYALTGGSAPALRQAFGKIRSVSADGGERLSSSLQKQLFNYNLRILISEAYMNKIMKDCRTETGPVVDCILGAAVSGCQVTNTAVTVDLLPSANTGRFSLQLHGLIQSNTQGVTPQATVYTSGYHNFVASKEINFDGQNFSTSAATISVNPHNTTTGISTKLSGIPILGAIANSIAAGEVENRRGQAEAIAASRVQDGVLPRFNSEVNAAFSKAGGQLNDELFSGLRSTNLFPDTYNYQTSDNLLTVNLRVMSPDQLGADVPDASLMTVNGATALFHESVLNNSIDQIGLAGQTLTEPELRAKIEAFLTKALNRPFKFDAPEQATPAATEDAEESKQVSGIIFAPTDPIRIRIQDDVMTIVIRAGFKQDGKEDIPMREVSVPLSFQVQGQQIAIQRGNVIVEAAEGQGGGISVNAVVRKKIQSVLPDRVVDGKIEFKNQDRVVTSYVQNILMKDGWVSVAVD